MSTDMVHDTESAFLRGIEDVCCACGQSQWRSLPIVGTQSLVSDGQVVRRPLAKLTCMSCGMLRSVVVPSAGELEQLFSRDYQLYAHPIGESFERERQEHYARWISSIVLDFQPRSIFEIGCGNGSLLHAISNHFPAAKLSGIEPSEAAAMHAQEVGLDVQRTLLEEKTALRVEADLVLSVNVLEHTRDPLGFLRAIKTILTPNSIGLVIFPDGDRASSELLIYDHHYSFSRDSINHLFSRAELKIRGLYEAPDVLGPFVAVLVSPAATASCAAPPSSSKLAELHMRRERYLRSWKELDAALTKRLEPHREIACFGVGEAAYLLATYAPTAWSHVQYCTADSVVEHIFRGKKVTPFRNAGDKKILLGVRPAAQQLVADRLVRESYTVIRWDDLIAG